MPDLLTLTGVVATPPRHITTNSGLEITSFRLASSQRRFDRDQKRWVDADTNWYTVNTFRQLALNTAASIERGQHVVVTGRLRIRSWETGEKSGTTIDLEADAVGHDLSWGTSVYTKSVTIPAPDAPAGSGWAASAPEPGGTFGEHPEGTEGGGSTGLTGPLEPAMSPAESEEALLPF
ncbi:single-stranded DNA-binding protein [Herbiconiux sp. YIM B11900]|uniref:single-stranded DNA-binding protein n=1 Tax=Herbiconiux sp. YIM B11900 TaxID=3404131 RepID=UPI003F85BFBF